jgi:ATP-binding protein involved in chromosome partitioning
VALKIARKGLRMFQQVNVPIAGIIENMSGYVCPSCGARHDIFGRGGGRRVAQELGVPFLGAIPLDPELVPAGDSGKPLVGSAADSPTARAFLEAAQAMAAQLSIVNLLESNPQLRPREIRLTGQTPPSILWDDDVTLVYDPYELRWACPCAACNEELTGRSLIHEGDIPVDVGIESARPVGRYGLNIAFTDGHATGIYTFDLLRRLGKSI